MATLQHVLTALGMEVLLLAVLLVCRRRRLAPVPIWLPSLAILIGMIVASLPADLVTPTTRPWLETALLLSRSYALLHLFAWAGFDLPAFLPWWPRPARILRDLVLLMIAATITVVVLQQQARVNVVGLVTTSAILTAVIGLAAQETLKDLFAGIMLQVDSPFREGDYLDLEEGINGWVVSLTLLSTRLQHVHGGQITLPNSRLWAGKIQRFAPRGPIARELRINLDISLPPDQARALLLKVASQNPLVLDQPEPEAFVYGYGDHAVIYELEVWQEDPTDQGLDLMRGQLLAQLWYALERMGERLPHPIREVQPRRLQLRSDDPTTVDLAERTALLHQNAIFTHLSEDQLRMIAPYTRCVRFAPGEAVVLEGEEGNAMFQVVKGTVEVLKRMEGGIVKAVAQLEAGDLFGEMSVFNQEPRSATVRAREECVLLEVEREDLRPLLEGNPQLVEKLALLIGERRAHLSNVSRERKEDQTNQLLKQMLQMFSTLQGN